MFFLPFPFFCLLMVMVGVMIVFSSTSLFTAWIGLEMGLLSFIPLIYTGKMSYGYSEAGMKYFLIQAFSSIVLLSGFLLLLDFSSYLVMFSLFLKLGAAPFHYWMLSVVEFMIWPTVFMFLTVQKISPLIILSMFADLDSLVMNFFVLSSALVGALGGLTVSMLRSVFTYSSIGHIAWLTAGLYLNQSLMMQYFFIYLLLLLPIVCLLNSFNFYHLIQISYSRFVNLKIILFFMMLSLGGLPPFLGFLSKWILLTFLAQSSMFILLFSLIMSSLFTLYYYLRLTFSAFMFSGSSLFYFNFSLLGAMTFYIILSLGGLMIFPLYLI
uniref:NADH-ubiquinone oxidoreductase chain 2 n=1 Tax=Gondwanalimnadia sp. MT-2020 TaxID=2731355 RepID=A0A6M4SRZ7_9CRUS|nr:NADH dehydrogenase subunit 2 [Gondwanalimnadia sp. MT-2020]